MKINELEKLKQLDENIGNRVVGTARAGFGDQIISGIKGSFSGIGTQKQLEYDLFVNDFIKDAIVSLQSAVKSGLVVPGVASADDKDDKDDDDKDDGDQMDLFGDEGDKDDDAGAVPKKIDEDKYHKLNRIFESIVNIYETSGKQPQQVGGAESISSYLMDWFGQWMNGVKWSGRETQAKSLIKAIETNYPNGNWKGAIQQLAKAAYAISSAGTSVPKGMRNAGLPGGAENSGVGDFGMGGKDGGGGGVRPSSNIQKITALAKKDPELAKKLRAGGVRLS
jgi:hypothetical protein